MKTVKDLSLSGSQINLHERPSPRSSTPRIKRPTSAVPAPGYEGPTRSRGCYERPQSADESLGGAGRNSEFTSRCSVAKSLLNSRQFESDSDLISPSPPLTPSPILKPGLAAKPPPGPSPPNPPPLEEDIVDLKFRNWFPNSLKYANELPAFIPDARISTNDIPETCRAQTSGESAFVAPRHAKSDNFLNRIGSVNSEKNARNVGDREGGAISEEDVGENSRNLRREIDQQRHQCQNNQENNGNQTVDRKREQSQRSEMYMEAHPSKYSDHVQSTERSSDSESVTGDTQIDARENGTQKRSAQQNMRYVTCRESNQCSNSERESNTESGADTARIENYRRDEPPKSNYNNEKRVVFETTTYSYKQHCDGYYQYDRDLASRSHNDQIVGNINENVGATSREYYMEYKDDKINEDNQQEQNMRHSNHANRDMSRTDNREYHNCNVSEQYEYYKNQEYTMKFANHITNPDDYYSNKYVTERAQPTPDSDRCMHYEPTKTQRYKDCEPNSRENYTRTKYESPEIYRHGNKNKYERNYHNPRGKAYQHSTNVCHYQNEEVLQRNAAAQNESDSARSEENHYANSMDIMDKLYSQKRKDRHKRERGKPPTKQFSDDIEYRQGYGHKNGKRKSLENLNSRFSKSLSEDIFTQMNSIDDSRQLEHERLPTENNVNRINDNGMNVNLRREAQDVSHYLDMYDFEQDEKILNHILKNSTDEQRTNSIPEIKITDESMINREDFPVKDVNSSTYNEIVDILKVLENEEHGLNKRGSNKQVQKDDSIMPLKTTTKINQPIISLNKNEVVHPQDNSNLPKEISSETVQVKDIYSFLDQVDNQATVSEHITKDTPSGSRSKLGELMKLSSADLAQKYLTLSINMDEKQIIITALEKKIEQIDKHCKEMKTDTDATVKRLQKFIAQLIKEKKELSEQCSDMCKEMEKKYKHIIETMEERHRIEIKKNTDKHLAAEKIRREKWIDNKTQKIKELTVKGLEPELLKMTNAHQEEIAELRKAHNRQLEENDGMWNRKISALKDKFEEDLQTAILQEKENNRKRLDEELKTMENNYQQQRQHLLSEIRIERENLDRQAEDMRNEKEKELNQKLEKMIKQNKEVCEKLEHKHRDEIRNLKEELNQEKQVWMEMKTAQSEEKEQLIREKCKRERDKHIELIIQKLEKEQTERNAATEAKMKSMKEQHEKDVEELESTINNIKSKLNEARTKLQDSEDQVNELKAQTHGLQIENKNQSELVQKLTTENQNLKQKSEHEANNKIKRLEEEIEQTRSYFETLIGRMKQDQERELGLVYGRVKETIGKKDEAIGLLTQQKQAALTQCANLEAILAQRKH